MSEAVALAGLRRLVSHSRDQLAEYSRPRPTGSSYLYAEGINRHAAMVLAVEVLTLVEQCITPEPPSPPGAGSSTTGRITMSETAPEATPDGEVPAEAAPDTTEATEADATDDDAADED